MDAGTVLRLESSAIDRALTFANLEPQCMGLGSHPDTGKDCLRLEADVREYSAFLVAMAVQYRHADDLLVLADRVQLQHTETGDTRFWFPGVRILEP